MNSSRSAPETQAPLTSVPEGSTAAGQLTERVFSWGRYPRSEHRQVYKPPWNDQIPEILNAAQPGGLLPFGQGRSYGDSCLNAGRGLVECHRLNRILGFDESTGLVRCLSPLEQASLLWVGQSQTMYMARTITAQGPLALTFTRLRFIAPIKA
jgi:hypothetical protein